MGKRIVEASTDINTSIMVLILRSAERASRRTHKKSVATGGMVTTPDWELLRLCWGHN